MGKVFTWLLGDSINVSMLYTTEIDETDDIT